MDSTLTSQNVEKEILLIEDIRSGKADFSVIYNKHYKVCKNSLLKKGASEDEINDIYQDAMIMFYNKIMKGDFKLTSKISTYLHSVVFNLWYKEFEKKSKFVNANTSDLGLEGDFDNQASINYMVSISKEMIHEDHYNEDEIKVALIKNLISSLPPKHNQLINLYLSGMKNEEIRNEMGYTNSDTFKTLKSKAITILKNKIKELKNTSPKELSFLNSPVKEENEMEKLFNIKPTKRVEIVEEIVVEKQEDIDVCIETEPIVEKHKDPIFIIESEQPLSQIEVEVKNDIEQEFENDADMIEEIFSEKLDKKESKFNRFLSFFNNLLK